MSVNSEDATIVVSSSAPTITDKTHQPDTHTSEARSLRQELQTMDKENADLRQKLTKIQSEAQNTINAYSKELIQVKQRLAQVEQSTQRSQGQGPSYSLLRNELGKLETLHHQTVERLRIAESQIRSGASQRKRVEEETRLNMESLCADNERLTEKLKENEAYMDQLLHNAMRDGRWNPAPDSTFRARLDHLHSDTRDWAKRWAHENFSLSHLPTERAAEVRQSFSKFVRCDVDGSLPAAIESPILKMKAKIPSLLLTAALAHLVEVEFFSNPFFCVDSSRVSVLKETYSDLADANFQQAHMWRSTLWRILNPPQTSNTTDREKIVSQSTSRHVRSLCDRIVNEFYLTPSSTLLKQVVESEHAERTKSLQEIFLQAANVATSLWTQKSYLSCMSLSDFCEPRATFNVESPLMVAHPLNKIDVEDASNSGREILVVTRPAILAFDEHDDKRTKSDQFRVLAKSIVWLEEPKKSGFFRS